MYAVQKATRLKKVSASYIKLLPPLRLYRDDVDQLLTIFENDGEKVDIKAGDYILSGPADFDELRRRTSSASLSALKLETANHSCPHCPSRYEGLSLTFGKSSAHLYVSNDSDTQLMGLALRIETFLKTKRSLVSYAASRSVYFSVIGAYAVLTCALSLPTAVANVGYVMSHGFHGVSLDFASTSSSLGTTLLSTIVLAYLCWALFTYQVRHCIVYLDERGARPGFMRRNRDQIILGLVVGIVGSVVGAIVGVVLTLLLTSPHH